jgi:hypothetical protein
VVSTIAVLLGFLVFSSVYLSRYQPLNARGTGGYSVRAPGLTLQSFDAYPPDGDLTQYLVEWQTGKKISVLFPLSNEGPFAVTVLGLSGPYTSRDGSVTFRLAGTGPISGPASGTVTRGWSPLRLDPGEGVQVLLELTLRDTRSNGSGSIVNMVGIRYRTFWIEQSITLPLTQSIYACRGKHCF